MSTHVTYHTKQIGWCWVGVTHYHVETDGRLGWWCEDEAGGYGVSAISAARAIAACRRPVMYISQRDALASVRGPFGDD